MRITIVTAGGAGMFCGSCMHDNTWARALRLAGADATLLPAYTPIRVDEEDISTRQVFFGGINVYLEYRSRLWRKLPRLLTRWLDHPWIIRTATRFGVSNDAEHLGALTVSMLAGADGPEKTAGEELAAFVATHLQPDVVCFSNALLAGALPQLKQRFQGPVYCILQGDDIFLEDLREPYRTEALQKIGEHARQFDGFLVHSRYYRDFMANYLKLPVDKFHILPLGIDLTGHDGVPAQREDAAFTIGYFARICPEKGLHALIEAFQLLHAKHPHVRLKAGGYLGKRDRKYFRDIQRATRSLGESFEYVGSPADHEGKVSFLKSLDVLSVPTVYQEPKGLYVLEALANGVPVVQPAHGAFPELIEASGGGLLVEPGNPQALADALETLMLDGPQRFSLATAGQSAVRECYNPQVMARATLDLFQSSGS